MKELELVLFKYDISNLENDLKYISKLLQEERAFFGSVKKIKTESEEDDDEVILNANETNQFMVENIGKNISYLFTFSSNIRLTLTIDITRQFLQLYSKIPVSIKGLEEKMTTVSKKIALNLEPTTFAIKDLDMEREVFKRLLKQNDYYSSSNFHFLASVSWINIYPSKSNRNKFYLPVDDSFYSKIPAYKTEKLKNDTFIVVLYKNLKDKPDIVWKITKSVIDYYRDFLTDLGIWNKVKWLPNWKEIYRSTLRDNGIKI